MTEPASAQELFRGRHFDQEIIVLCVRWYLTFKPLPPEAEPFKFAPEPFLRTLSSRLKLRPLESCTSTCHSRPSGSSSSFAQNISPASPISSTVSLPISFGLSSLCASSSPLVTNLIPKAPPSALLASVAVTSSSHSTIAP